MHKTKDEIEFLIKKGYLKEFICGNHAERKDTNAQLGGSWEASKQSISRDTSKDTNMRWLGKGCMIDDYQGERVLRVEAFSVKNMY